MDLFLRSSSSSCSCLFVRLFFFFRLFVCFCFVFYLFVFFIRNSTRAKEMLSVEILVTLYTQSLRLTRG